MLHRFSGCERVNRKADVVFIHGLGGDAIKTWRHGDDESTSWPHWLGQEFPEAGVWSLGYAPARPNGPASWVGLPSAGATPDTEWRCLTALYRCSTSW